MYSVLFSICQILSVISIVPRISNVFFLISLLSMVLLHIHSHFLWSLFENTSCRLNFLL